MKKFRQSIITSFLAGMIIGVLPANAEKFSATPQLRAQIGASVMEKQVSGLQGSAGISAICEKRLKCLKRLLQQIEVPCTRDRITALIGNYLSACGILGQSKADERVLKSSGTIKDLKHNIGVLMSCYKYIQNHCGTKAPAKPPIIDTRVHSAPGTREGRKGGYRRMAHSEKR